MGRAWWGDFELPLGTTHYWRIGPSELWITREAQEWSVGMVRGDDPMDEACTVAQGDDPPVAPDDTSFTRFAFRDPSPSIRLSPALADRPVIVRSAKPFQIPAGEAITIFVSSALWLQIKATNPARVLDDVPLYRPSDTWFGPSTLEGELCYAGRTHARIHLENLPGRAHRVLSSVRIRNRAHSALALERIRLPFPNLSIFASEAGDLWTEGITLERGQDDERAEVRLGKGPPPIATGAKRVSGPRTPVPRGLLVRTFGGLFGLRGGETRERVVE